MVIDNKTGLVLEGGGMRATFTAGVLDWLMDREIWFPYTIGVSAGASNGISYASRQRGRSRFSNIDLLEKRNYIGLSYFLKGRGYIDMDFLFYEYPDLYYPLDYDTCFRSPGRFVMVTSNCLTGRAEYFEEREDRDRLVDICCASCSIPVICPVKQVDGVPMVDGGVCDAIPIRRSIEEGYTKNVVVLTRNRGYRKAEKDFKLPGFIYRKYPALREQLRTRYRRYNELLDFVDQEEAAGRALVIAPERPLEAGRTERDVQKLQALYEEGYAAAEKAFLSTTLSL
ncbi:putative patatin/cPLA2 family phospholipase [Parabacteroides sp. PFB2-10]|uniref:patatin-like phospholipase family protein n=1 Tax=Parabacteroides sp. PFB2-10 TaxID=1742405 RepID=UPI00247356DB|nr:patatin family protein [Parabacteroides sp. PFB2-10]MDH6312133.1 putative patatin/cPLA2 family phospholipase [Parabacteroides sp. PFB2-10]MDL2245126.1 patatin family protein [Parabacteroides sp. OttesenSCG-928-J18]